MDMLYRLLKVIGSGSYGKVYYAKCEDRKGVMEEFAVKQVH